MTASKQSQDGTHGVPSLLCLEAVIMSSILTLLGIGNQKSSLNLSVPNVQLRISDEGQRRRPKHVEFYNGINLDN